MKTQHVLYKFECADCNKTFAKESYLIRHQMRIHGGNSKEEEVTQRSVEDDEDDDAPFLPISVNLRD